MCLISEILIFFCTPHLLNEIYSALLRETITTIAIKRIAIFERKNSNINTFRV